jgi:type III pantothenate kinase
MLLIDIGNTNINFASTKNGNIVRVYTLPTDKIDKKAIKKIIKFHLKKDILICSVVPQLTKMFKDLGAKLGVKIKVAGKDIPIPIKCLYNKKQVGMDRLVGAFAARSIYPQPRLIIDFGTAITFDFLSKKGVYLGGLILPGIGSSLKVLSSCALLPEKINLKRTQKIIPKNTEESISKGVEEGFSAMINSLVKRYKLILKLSYKEIPIVTGGAASLIMSRLNFSYIYEPLLVLKGLAILS